MKKSILVFVLALTASAQVFASVQVCGTISADHGALTFSQYINGTESIPSSIYANTRLPSEKQKYINGRLAGYAGFREVCVMISTGEAAEGDTVVDSVVSATE